NLPAAWDESEAVGLMQAVLACERKQVEALLAERGHPKRRTAEVEDGVRARDPGGQHAARLFGAERRIGHEYDQVQHLWEIQPEHDGLAIVHAGDTEAAEQRRRHVIGMALDLCG